MKKNAIYLLMFCMFINFLVPKFAVEPEDYSTLSRIMEKQSTLLSFFSFASLPMKMVSDLFVKQAAAPRKGSMPAVPKKSNSANTSSDYSLVSQNNILSSLKSDSERPLTSYAQVQDALAVYDGRMRQQSGASPGSGTVFLCLLMFFFLRPRSALDDLLIFSHTRM